MTTNLERLVTVYLAEAAKVDLLITTSIHLDPRRATLIHVDPLSSTLIHSRMNSSRFDDYLAVASQSKQEREWKSSE